MRNFIPRHLAAGQRSTMRDVALAYRRTYRRTKAEGERPERMHREAYEAAVRAPRSLRGGGARVSEPHRGRDA
jgi:hypothetical protein